VGNPCSCRCEWWLIVGLVVPTMREQCPDGTGVLVRSLSTKMSHKLGQVLGIVSLLFGESTGIQADDGVGFPRAGHPGPPLGMAGLGRGIDLAALGESSVVLAAMALSWGHEREGAVTVLLVIPNDEAGYPLARRLQVSERLAGRARLILEGLEQGLGEGVVIADRRSAKGRHDPEALQGRQHRCPLHGATVIGMQDQGLGRHSLAVVGTAERL